MMLPNLDLALDEHFGFTAFRAGQREAMASVFATRDALVVMPTGSGKSLCYQLPALIAPFTTIVLSPLIALMKDQVDALVARNKRATLINSTLSTEEQQNRLAILARGWYKIVYVAPERLRNADFLTALKQTRVSLIAVDEAHCISQWGHDFRPDYLRIHEFAASIQRPPIIALTATATPQVQSDIISQLGLVRVEKIVTGFNRPNLALRVRYTPNETDKYRELEKILRGKSDSTIIYAGTRRDAEAVAEFCNEVVKIPAAFYHAGMEDDERTRAQDAFMRGEVPIIAATNAFGMGVDKPDIRAVIHFALPSTVEAYYQEIGRAGRDGEPARITLLYSPEDRALQEWFIENDAPEPRQVRQLFQILVRNGRRSNWIAPTLLQRETGLNDSKLQLALHQLEHCGAARRLGDSRGLIGIEANTTTELDLTESQADTERRRAHRRRLLARIIEYAETNACRRQFILDYFGDCGLPTASDCCDNHAAAMIESARPVETEEDKIPLILLEIVRTLARPVGRDKLAMIARGSRAQEILKFGYAKHRYYAKLPDYTLDQLGEIIQQLVQHGFLKIVGGEYPVVALSPQGAQALRKRIALDLNIPALPSQEKRAEKRAARQAGGTIERTLELAQKGLTVAQIAEQRGVTIGTIYGHLEQLVAAGKITPDRFIEPSVRAQILAAMKNWDGQWLSSLKELLPAEISYDQIRFVVAAEKKEKGNLIADPPSESEDALPKGQFSEQDRAHAIWLMGEQRLNENVPTLIHALQESNGNVRRLAASALGKTKDPRATEPLIQLLEDNMPQVRQYAIKALGEIADIHAESALQKIADAADEKDYNRKSAFAALEAIRRSLAHNRTLEMSPTNDACDEQSKETVDAITSFLSRAHPKSLRGPWHAGFALDFHDKFIGAQRTRTELGELMYRFKYCNEQALGEKIAARVADFIAAHPELRADLIVPVPSTQKERAYDPVPVLARLISARTPIALNESVLVKTRQTQPQKEMQVLPQKTSNVAGAFRITDANLVRGKRVLLLDDLYDSGATLAEATRILTGAGALQVCVLTVTKTIHSA